jgi:hypothetical protein
LNSDLALRTRFSMLNKTRNHNYNILSMLLNS